MRHVMLMAVDPTFGDDKAHRLRRAGFRQVSGFGKVTRGAFRLPEQYDEFRQGDEQVGFQAVVGDAEDSRFGVLDDRDGMKLTPALSATAASCSTSALPPVAVTGSKPVLRAVMILIASRLCTMAMALPA
jgi:hypothetical protein